jgi:hypothetical protein
MTSFKKDQPRALGSTFVKRKKTNCLPLLSKGKHRFIPPPLGILLYNCHCDSNCAFTLWEFIETLECITSPFIVTLILSWWKVH